MGKKPLACRDCAGRALLLVLPEKHPCAGRMVHHCTPLYTAPLWGKFKKSSMQRLQVAYNDCFRILLKRPRWSSASELFVNAGVKTLQALLRNLMYRFICRLNNSKNEVIMLLSNPSYSSVRYQSYLWRHWYKCLL